MHKPTKQEDQECWDLTIKDALRDRKRIATWQHKAAPKLANAA